MLTDEAQEEEELAKITRDPSNALLALGSDAAVNRLHSISINLQFNADGSVKGDGADVAPFEVHGALDEHSCEVWFKIARSDAAKQQLAARSATSAQKHSFLPADVTFLGTVSQSHPNKVKDEK